MNPDEIQIYGVIVLEPLGSLTDFITGVVSLILAFLVSQKQTHSKSIQLFKLYFLFTGLATVCAGVIGHALLHYISVQWKMVGWSLSAIGLFYFESASLEYFKKHLSDNQFRKLKLVIVLQLVIFFILLIMPYTRDFKVVQWNASFCYITIILPLYLYSILRWKIYQGWLVVAAIVHAGITAAVYNMEVTINPWFNHHVLTHILMTLYVIFIYYAVIRLHSRDNADHSMQNAYVGAE